VDVFEFIMSYPIKEKILYLWLIIILLKYDHSVDDEGPVQYKNQVSFWRQKMAKIRLSCKN
jgi:hypothetical protein